MDLDQKNANASNVPADKRTDSVDKGIIFDGNLENKEADNFADSPVSRGTDPALVPNSESTTISAGIESGANRFTVPANVTNDTISTPAPIEQSSFPKLDHANLEPTKVSPPVSFTEEPKGEILTTFINTQNYADSEVEKANPSMPQPTNRNETNFAVKKVSLQPKESAFVHPVTPDPTRVAEVESNLNQASFSMPAQRESAAAELVTNDIGQADVPHSSPKVSSAGVLAPNVVLNSSRVPIEEPSSDVNTRQGHGSLTWLWVVLALLLGFLVIGLFLSWASENGLINLELDRFFSKIL